MTSNLQFLTRLIVLMFGLAFSARLIRAAEPRPIDYARDVRPILSDNCFQCHGPDAKTREAKLRLDTKEGLFAERDDITPFKPGKLDESDAWIRIVSGDKDEQMPPPDSNRKLKPEQITLIKRWIEEGTPFQEHWAFQTPRRSALPEIGNAWWPKNPIDHFIAAELEQKKLAPSPEAAKEILLRRASFDLIGLPPRPADLDLFLADTGPNAFEKAVDRLLASPGYGEHMGRYWLDAARYGDTHGLHLDNERSMWPYRDWVIRAFNENLPFDQFTIWQLAGDLLPNATRDQLIASGFNRCNVTTGEGGSINEELLFRYAVDRTETAASVWMGLTAGCAVCHDHKFDPISAKEFYQLYAFFNSAADPAMDGNLLLTPPVLKLTTPEQQKQLDQFEAKIAAARKRMNEEVAQIAYTDPASLVLRPPIIRLQDVWLDDALPEDVKPQAAGHPLTWVSAEGGQVKNGSRAIKRSGEGITQDYFNGLKKPFTVPTNGKLFAHVWIDPQNPPKALMLQWHSEGNWKYRANWGDKDAITFGAAGTPEKLLIGDLPKAGEWARIEVNIEDLKLKPGTRFDGLAVTQYGGTVFWDEIGVSSELNPATDPAQSQLAWEKLNQGKDLGEKAPKDVREIFRSINPKDRTPEHTRRLREYFLTAVYADARERLDPLNAELKALDEQKQQADAQIVATLIMRDLEQKRDAFIMVRGQYDKPGEKVQPGVPAVLPPLPKKERATRVELAQWLVSPDHPLTSRVAVNRLWQQFFGTGLVKTTGDFGAQGEPPSHPELLDWLATEFRENGWDVKKLVRVIVTSATYRQDSRVTPKLLELDPENRLLARGPRVRLDAEAIRDNALFVSGLMDGTVGGKPVKPYQPEKIWEPVGFVGSNTREYTQDRGAALYRRSIYTFWKRTAPAPSMTTFDAPSRESSCVRRERSNTPLQALLLMNDVQYFEAARALGERMVSEGGVTPEERLAHGFRLINSRRPLENERKILKEAFERQLTKFAADLQAAKQAVSVGESKPKTELSASELAAYTMLANVLLNMDEAVTKN